MKICPKCHTEFDDSHKFCGNCGFELIAKKVFCSKCGKELGAGQNFCGECGTNIQTSSAQNISEKAIKLGKTVHDKAGEILSQENIDKAKSKVVIITNSVRNSEIFSPENIDKTKQNLSQTVENIKSKDFFFDLIKMFPTSDSQYDAYLKWILFCLIATAMLFSLGVISGVDAEGLEMVQFLINLPNVYITLYILIKSGALKYIAKILLGLLVSVLIWSLGSIAGPSGMLLLFILTVGFSIHINKKRFAFIKNNSQYLIYPVGIVVFTFLLLLIGGLTLISLEMNASSFELFFIVSACVIYVLGIYYITRRFMRQEQKRGISFLEMNKRLWSVPITLIFYLVSFLTIFHFFDADSGSIINGDSTDGNLPNSDLNSTEIASTSISHQVNQNVTPINVDANSYGQNVDSVIDTAHTTRELGVTGNLSFNNDLSATANNATDATTSADNHNPLQNSDFTVIDKIGHTEMHFDSEHGTLYDGQGKMIATLQGPHNNYLVTIEGRTIARYDPDMKTLYDGFDQPLDVKMDGSTFQQIKDTKGNGVEIINGEIFDAKTHEKIGHLET